MTLDTLRSDAYSWMAEYKLQLGLGDERDSGGGDGDGDGAGDGGGGGDGGDGGDGDGGDDSAAALGVQEDNLQLSVDAQREWSIFSNFYTSHTYNVYPTPAFAILLDPMKGPDQVSVMRLICMCVCVFSALLE
jgi:hypothetical protein